MKKRVYEIVIFIFIMLYILTGCSNDQKYDINDKLDSELGYLEDLIFKIAIKHAKGEYLENDEINWDYIKGDVQSINDSWTTLVLDLTAINVPNENILAYSNDLNDLLISVSQKSDIILMEKLNSIYKKIISFKELYSNDKNQIKKNKIKLDVLKVYVLVISDKYVEAKYESNNVVKDYKELMKDEKYAEENNYNLNRIYVLLEELNNSIQTQNIDLIRMKYIIAIENL